MREALKVWLRNEKEIEEAIINGEETQVVESDFGANELVIDFLKETGLWDILTGMPIKMGKNNGYPGKVILGILILKELMAIEKLSGVGKIIQDGKLSGRCSGKTVSLLRWRLHDRAAASSGRSR